jgi:Tfp pilus assembly protein PilN
MRAVNLLTPELRSAQKGSGAPRPSAMETSGGIGAFALIGALALIVAAVAGYVLAGNTVKERKATLASVSTQNDETVKKAAEMKPYADFQDLASDRANTVQALAGARFNWDQSLRDLSRALPSNVYLSSLKGDVGGDSGGGTSGGSIRGAIASAPAIDITGCTHNQTDVAALMSRLRNVQGVTRVSLSKSEKADTVAADGATVGPCGKGSPPNFDLVVFFEKATVGADLSAATGAVDPAAAAAAATPTSADPTKPPPTDTKTSTDAVAPGNAPAATPTPAATQGATP